MKVKVQEVARRGRFFRVVQSGLGIAIVAGEDDIPADLVAAITKPVLKWKKKRADKAYALSLTFSATPEMHQAIEAALFQLYRRVSALQNVFDRTGSISVTLCDDGGRPHRSYSLDLLGLLQGKYRRIETPVNSSGQPEKPRRRKGMDSGEETPAKAKT